MLVWPGSVTLSITGIRTRFLQGRNHLFGCCLLELWQLCCIPNLGAYILGGGIAISAPKIQNGYRIILQVMNLLIMTNLTDGKFSPTPMFGWCLSTDTPQVANGTSLFFFFLSLLALCCFLLNGNLGGRIVLTLVELHTHTKLAFYLLLTFLTSEF